MTARIHIRHANEGSERERAIEYISKNMRKKHGSCPPPETSPPHIFIALHGETLVGSLGMVFGERDRELPFEKLFSFDPNLAPVQYVREAAVYYSRWNSSLPGIGLAVWLAASHYAVNQGMLYTAQTIKDEMYPRYLTFGCEWYPIPDAKLRLENVGETEREYFLKDDPPRPWLGVLKEQIRELQEIVQKIARERSYTFVT